MNENIHLVDSHAHIYGPDFEKDLPEMLARAREAGVNHILTVGADVYSSRECCKLALQYDSVHAAVGIHPHDADTVTDACYEEIRNLAMQNPKVVAIGEIGLDYYRDRSSREAQDRVFRKFIHMARELSLPIIVHDRDAHADVMRILREEKASEVGGVLHCFSGDLEMAKECIDMGFYISIPGTVTYPANEALRDVVRGVKIEHLLVETDCPYLSPIPYRGKRNEPAYVRLAAEKIAEIKGLSIADVARITSLNVRRLFGIDSAENHAKIAYRIRNSLYLNITNHCSNRCTFCPKFEDFTVKGHNLMLEDEPTFAEIMAAIREQGQDRSEVVFCGYGESLLRLDLVKRIATELKKNGERIRINSDGQANLVHGRNILPELHNLVDVISVSLNAPDAATYAKLCNTPYGEKGYEGICDFLREAKKYIPHVVATVVTVPGIDVEATGRVAEELGVEFRVREYTEVG